MKKIRMRRSAECLLESEATEEELLKDFGREKDENESSWPTLTLTPNRKLELPKKLPDYGTATSGFDESPCDSADVSVGTKQRSKVRLLNILNAINFVLES
jgi:hypothetical protein